MISSKQEQKVCESDPEIKRFLKGYEQFKADYFPQGEKNALYKKLVEEGQSPKTMVIACSDSRVDPSIILGSMPGELFVVRNVANLVPPYDNDPKHHGTSAALEFAVLTLGVSHIIVLGHSHCGGIRALLASPTATNPLQPNSFISSWMNIANVAKEKVLAESKNEAPLLQEKMCEEQSLRISLNNLLTFPWIHEKVVAGTLSLHAWRFDLNTGNIACFNPQSQVFETLLHKSV